MLQLDGFIFTLHSLIHAQWVPVTDTSYLDAYVFDTTGRIHNLTFFPEDNDYQLNNLSYETETSHPVPWAT